MSQQPATYTFGDPLAEVGTPGWAERIRVVMLSKLDGTKFSVHDLKLYLVQFFTHRGWTMLTRQDGRPYVHFSDFVEAPKPWGLGTEFNRFKSLIAIEIGEREFDRLTASEDARQKDEETGQYIPSGHEGPMGSRSAKRLRAVNRAHPVIQRLYDQDLIGVDVAAKFGPADTNGRKQEMNARAEILGERLADIRVFRPDLSGQKLKREVNRVAREVLEIQEPTPLDALRRAWKKASAEERQAFIAEVRETVEIDS
jgi:hypothetical protein